MTNHEIIRLVDISKTFDDTPVLKNINLYIRRNEFVTYLDPVDVEKQLPFGL